jgi:hypothetical protein
VVGDPPDPTGIQGDPLTVGVPPTLLAAVVGWGSSQTAVGSALGGWPSSRKVSLELAGRVRCSGLPSDWKLRRITPNRHLLGLSKGYIGVATLPPPPNGFPSSLIEASARPTVETTPQQIEGFSALGKQPYALPLPVRRDGLLRQMASLHIGYDAQLRQVPFQQPLSRTATLLFYSVPICTT